MIKQEFIRTFQKLPLVLHLAWSDIRARYARSVLGPFWLVLTTAIGVVGLGYIWSILFKQDRETFIPALCIGLVIWQFLSSCVLEAPQTFIQHAAIIRNTLNPIFVFPLYVIGKNLIIFAHNILIILVVLVLYPPDFGYETLLVIPGFMLLLGNMIWIVSLIAVFGTRYRDLGPAISSFMTILFFLSPVIYKPVQLGIKAKLLWFNPFTYFISMIRDPITGHASPAFAYLVMFLMLIFGWGLLAYVMKRTWQRLVFWL